MIKEEESEYGKNRKQEPGKTTNPLQKEKSKYTENLSELTKVLIQNERQTSIRKR